MPISPTYPGVYIQEVPSGVRTLTGVATSIGAFVGYFSRGPMNEAVRVLSYGDFERIFGGLRADSEAAYAIDQFFQNGGSQAWIVRTAAADTAIAAQTVLRDDADGVDALALEAASPGEWGNNLRVEVDYGTQDPSATFNLTVREIVDGAEVNSETYLNLTMGDGSRNVTRVINDSSKLIRVTAANAALRPAPTGTATSTPIGDPAAVSTTDTLIVDGVEIGPLGTAPTSATGLANTLQGMLRTADPASTVTFQALGSLATGAMLVVRAGSANDDDGVTVTGDLVGGNPGELNFSAPNVQRYALGATAAALKQGAGTEGLDGALPDGTALRDALAAFDPVDLINILCLPDTMNLPDGEALAVIGDAIAYADRRRCFYVVDVPQAEATRDEVAEIEAWIDQNGTIRHKNAALYFPRPQIADPLDEFRLRTIASSGTAAGVYARTDAERGVWKAPAGIDAQLRGVQALETVLTDDQNGVLNPIGVNCLRNFRVPGNVVWGARTLVGADLLASEWKYVPVRRLTLFLEESLYRGTQWVVFEPNDESLWAQIRLNVGAFMQGLFRQGAFQGTSPRDAYVVRCDRETTTQDDINRGIVNIVVGFAPLKPAEFVILNIQQLAGQGLG
ncbi:MAG: phage tail sheath subtilisin-like domain-containing protein [Acidobacteriota bacterium]